MLIKVYAKCTRKLRAFTRLVTWPKWQPSHSHWLTGCCRVRAKFINGFRCRTLLFNAPFINLVWSRHVTRVPQLRRRCHNGHRGPVGNMSDFQARDAGSIPSTDIFFFSGPVSGVQIYFIKNLTELFYLSTWIVIPTTKCFYEMLAPFGCRFMKAIFFISSRMTWCHGLDSVTSWVDKITSFRSLACQCGLSEYNRGFVSLCGPGGCDVLVPMRGTPCERSWE
jgi:hypothetical protein